MQMRLTTKTLLVMAALAWPLAPPLASPAHAQSAIDVVTSIKPVHSLVAGVMEGVGTPALIVEGAASPHAFALKPSQARAIQNAELVFWIGPQMESFLEASLATIGANAHSVLLGNIEGLVRLELREGGAFERHGHSTKSAHDHDHHDDEHDHAHEGHGDHDAHATDMHYWLDPQNARVMVGEIATALSAADPANASAYERNASAMSDRLDNLTARLQGELQPLEGRGFIVFHDAYRYFENRFGLTASGSITVTPDVMPGAERIREIRSVIGDLEAACVFSEPQFTPNLVTVVTEGTDARSAVLDPLGALLADGPGLYFELIETMAASFKDCLAPNS